MHGGGLYYNCFERQVVELSFIGTRLIPLGHPRPRFPLERDAEASGNFYTTYDLVYVRLSALQPDTTLPPTPVPPPPPTRVTIDSSQPPALPPQPTAIPVTGAACTCFTGDITVGALAAEGRSSEPVAISNVSNVQGASEVPEPRERNEQARVLPATTSGLLPRLAQGLWRGHRGGI